MIADINEWFLSGLTEQEIINRLTKKSVYKSSKKELTEWDYYKIEVRRLTEINKGLIKDIHKRNFKTWHIDHIISIWYGYKNDIPTELIAAPMNLRVISAKDNVKKGKYVNRHDLLKFLEYAESLGHKLEVN